MELEDDLFFADLSRQISLLIMDDDDEVPVSSYPSVSFQDLSRGNYYPNRAASPYVVEQSCRRESKGTGVFIPRSSQPRRRNRQGRHNSINSKSPRQLDNNTRTASHQVSYTTSLYPKQG
ncbi:uncharacterized protein [Euphorbia lathyris]|uniref:uncharacterized protein n=1 Tax=Euphorbia lathyris TaxID=212925 RepID=UPI0033137B92